MNPILYDRQLFLASLSREAAEQFVQENVADQLQQSDFSSGHEGNGNGIANEGKTVREKEYAVYARLLDFSQFKTAPKAEIQEQWQVKIPRTEENAGSGSIRVRKVTKRNGRITYELTTKSDIKKNEKIECTVETSEEMFIQFKVLSNKGMLKHRYIYPIKGTGMKWEVDAYPDGNGGYYPWVRAEIDVKDLKTQLPDFPLKNEEIIFPPEFGNITEEQHQQKVSELYERFFLLKNEFLKPNNGEKTKIMSTTRSEEDGESDQDEKQDDQVKSPEEARKERDENAMLSPENITDDKTKADLVVKRADQIKEAKGIDDEDDEDSGDDFGGDDKQDDESEDSNEEGSEPSEESEGEEGNDKSEGGNGDTPSWDGDDKGSDKSEGQESKDKPQDKVSKESVTYEAEMVQGNTNDHGETYTGDAYIGEVESKNDEFSPDLPNDLTPEDIEQFNVILQHHDSNGHDEPHDGIDALSFNPMSQFMDRPYIKVVTEVYQEDKLDMSWYTPSNMNRSQSVNNRDGLLKQVGNWLTGKKDSGYVYTGKDGLLGLYLVPNSFYGYDALLKGQQFDWLTNWVMKYRPIYQKCYQFWEEDKKTWSEWVEKVLGVIRVLPEEGFNITDKLRVAQRLQSVSVGPDFSRYRSCLDLLSKKTFVVNEKEAVVENIAIPSHTYIGNLTETEEEYMYQFEKMSTVPLLSTIHQHPDFKRLVGQMCISLKCNEREAAQLIYHGLFHMDTEINYFLKMIEVYLISSMLMLACPVKLVNVVVPNCPHQTRIYPQFLEAVKIEPKIRD